MIFLFIHNCSSVHCCENIIGWVVGASGLALGFQTPMGRFTHTQMDKYGTKNKRQRSRRLAGQVVFNFFSNTWIYIWNDNYVKNVRLTHWSLWRKGLHFLLFYHNKLIMSYLMVLQLIQFSILPILLLSPAA